MCIACNRVVIMQMNLCTKWRRVYDKQPQKGQTIYVYADGQQLGFVVVELQKVVLSQQHNAN